MDRGVGSGVVNEDQVCGDLQSICFMLDDGKEEIHGIMGLRVGLFPVDCL